MTRPNTTVAPGDSSLTRSGEAIAGAETEDDDDAR
jgi:hypothetical protein